SRTSQQNWQDRPRPTTAWPALRKWFNTAGALPPGEERPLRRPGLPPSPADRASATSGRRTGRAAPGKGTAPWPIHSSCCGHPLLPARPQPQGGWRNGSGNVSAPPDRTACPQERRGGLDGDTVVFSLDGKEASVRLIGVDSGDEKSRDR